MLNAAPHDNPSITQYVSALLQLAISLEASDIHLEPYADYCRIRLRIDGILSEILKINPTFVPRIMTRLKILAKLDIAEKRLPQDGRLTLEADQPSLPPTSYLTQLKPIVSGDTPKDFPIKLSTNQTYDLRLSTCPTIFGEKIAIRILTPQNTTLDIHNLGLEPPQKEQFYQHIQRPQGMILVTGPTGSGKTNTLYTILKTLNAITKNISSVEDPVEIILPGINQVAINPKIGITFATVLKTFLRQDPDILMVGEIRDLETAQIAIKAAQTGHLVLATLHTNNATDSITRLLNMGISSFNLASTISLILAQRLLRRLCPHCKSVQQLPSATLTFEGLPTNTTIFTTQGCPKCHKGYKGRIGVFELLPISNTISNLILQQASIREIASAAQLQGMQTMRQVALTKVAAGITSLAEVNRVLLNETL